MKYVNIYRDPDTGGRFISNEEYSTTEQAFESRDQLSTYIETVGIVRKDEMEAKQDPEKVGGYDEMFQGMLRLAKSKQEPAPVETEPSPLYELAEIYSKPGTKYEPAPFKSYWGPVVADQFPLDNQMIDLFDGCNTYYKCTYFNGEIFDSKEKRIELWNGAALNGWEWRYEQEPEIWASSKVHIPAEDSAIYLRSKGGGPECGPFIFAYGLLGSEKPKGHLPGYRIFQTENGVAAHWKQAEEFDWEWRYAEEEAKPEPGIEYPWNQASVSIHPAEGYKLELKTPKMGLITGQFVLSDDPYFVPDHIRNINFLWRVICSEDAEWRYAK